MSALLVGSHIRGHASIRTRAVALVHVTQATSNSFQYAIRFTRYVTCADYGAQWLSGRVLDSRSRGRGFEPRRRHCIVVLEQDTFILA